MLTVKYARWNQTPDDLRKLSLAAEHRRTRERFMALYEITQGSCSSVVALIAGRHHQTVLSWVHKYNDQGPDSLTYCRSGARPLFAKKSRKHFTIK